MRPDADAAAILDRRVGDRTGLAIGRGILVDAIGNRRIGGCLAENRGQWAGADRRRIIDDIRRRDRDRIRLDGKVAGIGQKGAGRCIAVIGISIGKLIDAVFGDLRFGTRRRSACRIGIGEDDRVAVIVENDIGDGFAAAIGIGHLPNAVIDIGVGVGVGTGRLGVGDDRDRAAVDEGGVGVGGTGEVVFVENALLQSHDSQGHWRPG